MLVLAYVLEHVQVHVSDAVVVLVARQAVVVIVILLVMMHVHQDAKGLQAHIVYIVVMDVTLGVAVVVPEVVLLHVTDAVVVLVAVLSVVEVALAGV